MGNVNSKTLALALDEIYEDCIAISKERSIKPKKLLDFLINSILLPVFQDDADFENLYSNVYYTGSFFDGLRVNNPNEFDVNFVLSLPSEATVTSSTNHHTSIIVKNHKFSTGNFVDTEKVKSWFQSLVDKVCFKINHQFTMENKWYKVHRSSSGPARTLIICDYFKTEYFDVDLVPVFENKSYEFLVPKPREVYRTREWRISYPEKERQLLHEKVVAKKVIKILKRLRDVQKGNWHSLCSYYIKTVVLHCLDMVEESLHNDLLYMLNKSVNLLSDFLNEGRIPFYHDHSFNLLEKVGDENIRNIKFRLFKIFEHVKEDEKYLYLYLDSPCIVKESRYGSIQFRRFRMPVDDIDSDEEFAEMTNEYKRKDQPTFYHGTFPRYTSKRVNSHIQWKSRDVSSREDDANSEGQAMETSFRARQVKKSSNSSFYGKCFLKLLCLCFFLLCFFCFYFY